MSETKIEKQKRCQEILKKGIILEEEKEFLNELIKNHPDYDLKKGKGILDFFIKMTEWGTKGFWIKRVDGSETDFSYKQCLTPRTYIQEIKTACRNAIEKDIISQKIEGFIAHHKEIPFIEIFNLWIKNKNPKELELEETKDNQVKIKFKDINTSEDFRKFHNSIAKIELVSEEEHNQIHFGKKEENKDDSI
jgi:hypothetical protein